MAERLAVPSPGVGFRRILFQTQDRALTVGPLALRPPLALLKRAGLTIRLTF